MRTLSFIVGILLCSVCVSNDGVELETVTLKTKYYEVDLDTQKHTPSYIKYTVYEYQVSGEVPDERDWWTPHAVNPDWVLEPDDYAGSSYDKGHLRALSLTRREDYRIVNATCAISPQHYVLNRGAWKSWEAHVADLAKKHGIANVEIECEFRGSGQLPQCDEPYLVPSYYNVWVETKAGVEKWRFPNDATASGSHVRFKVVPDED